MHAAILLCIQSHNRLLIEVHVAFTIHPGMLIYTIVSSRINALYLQPLTQYCTVAAQEYLLPYSTEPCKALSVAIQRYTWGTRVEYTVKFRFTRDGRNQA